MNKGVENLTKNWEKYRDKVKDINDLSPESIEAFGIIK